MNKIARGLFIIGWVCIASGVILAFANYKVLGVEETILGGTEIVEQESFVIFISYVIAGVITGLMMFGFAEIVKILDEKRDIAKDTNKHIVQLAYSLSNQSVSASKEGYLNEEEKIMQEKINRKNLNEFSNNDAPKKSKLNSLIDSAINNNGK